MNFAIQRTDEYKQSEQSHTLSARDYKGATDLMTIMRWGGCHNMDNAKMVVRRLTPNECETLQGYEQNWTLIGEPQEEEVTDYELWYDDDFNVIRKDPIGTHKETVYYWTDSAGKKRKCTDSNRYKALGNSIGIPAWMHIIKGISAQYDGTGHTPTMGSLFDGIGGFPRIWEHYNGKGTSVWASEIEEFCIAVTKAHFPETE